MTLIREEFEDKKNNKVSQMQFEKFKELMNEYSYKESDTQ